MNSTSRCNVGNISHPDYDFTKSASTDFAREVSVLHTHSLGHVHAFFYYDMAMKWIRWRRTLPLFTDLSFIIEIKVHLGTKISMNDVQDFLLRHLFVISDSWSFIKSLFGGYMYMYSLQTCMPNVSISVELLRCHKFCG